MNERFTDTNIEEESLDLLFGLATEEKAEELRRFVATDANAAKVFADVRKTFDLVTRAVKLETNGDVDESLDSKNVALDARTFETSASLGFDAAVGAFEEGAFGEKNQVRFGNNPNKSNFVLDANKRLTDNSTGKSAKSKKRRRENSEVALTSKKSLIRYRRIWFSRRSCRLVKDECFAFTKRTFRFFFEASLFCKMTLVLAFFGLFISIAIGVQEYRLRSIFSEDCHLQVVVPQFLVRNMPQAITVTTKDLSGNPRRMPVKFRFTDAVTGEFLLLHTEGGNVEGKIKYDLPSMNDFPNKVKLCVSIGGDEAEAFDTILEIQDSVDMALGEFAPSLFASSPDVVDSVSSDHIYTNCDFTDLLNNQWELRNIESKQSIDTSSDDSVIVKLVPELGRLFLNFSNRVSVFCSTSSGNALSKRLILCDGERVVTSCETGNDGWGTFDFTPIEGKHYFLAFDDAFQKDETRDLSSESGEDKALTDLFVDDDHFETFNNVYGRLWAKKECESLANFAFEFPEKTFVKSDLYFRPLARIVDVGAPLDLTISSFQKQTVVAVVEDNNAIVAQCLLNVTDGNKDVSLTLPNNVGGVLRVSFFKQETGFLAYVGETFVYRRCWGGESEIFKVAIPTEDDCSNDSLDVDQAVINLDYIKNNKYEVYEGNRSFDENPVKLSIYCAKGRLEALSALTLNDILGSATDLQVEKTLLLFANSVGNNQPVLFDNLRKIRALSGVKLRDFHEKEANTTTWITRLGFLGCLILIVLSIFFVGFKTISFGRGVAIIGFATVVGLVFCVEQKILDYSSELSESVDLSGVEISNDSIDSGIEKYEVADRNSATMTICDRSEVKTPRLVTTRKIGQGRTTLILDDFLTAEELVYGILLFKLEGDNESMWEIKSVADLK